MNLPGQAELVAASSLGLLLFARMLPLALLVPWLSPGSLVSERAGVAPLLSAAVALVLAVVLYPTAAPHAPGLPASLLWLGLLALRELLLGTVYAFALSLPLWSLYWAGRLIDVGLWPASASPQARAIFGELLGWLGVLAFFALGGHRVALSALADGVIAHPPGVLSGPRDPAALVLGALQLFNDAFAAALLIALPLLASVLLLELSLGLAARASGAAFLPALAPELRGLLGLCVVWTGAAVLFYRLPSAFRDALAAAERLWRSW